VARSHSDAGKFTTLTPKIPSKIR